MDPRVREEMLLASAQEGDETAVGVVENGINQGQAVEKLLKIEMNEPELKKEISDVLAKTKYANTPFEAIQPTREFMLGNTTLFDEYSIYGDIEDSFILTMLHPGFYPYAIALYKLATFLSIMTRSREGFQQKTLRSYISTSHRTIQTPNAKKGGPFIPLNFGKM